MNLRPDEITGLIKSQIKNYRTKLVLDDVGTVCTVGDGISRVNGLEKCMSGELLECDVVVTDYSSLAYEAYLLGKKLLFYIPDIESYRVTPGLNRDPLELAPSLCALDEGELVVRLQMLADDPSTYPQGQLDRFIGRAFNAPDSGTVAARIVDFLIDQSR